MSREPSVTLSVRYTSYLWVLGLVYVCLLSFNSLTRTRSFTEDSMNYVDVARHILAREGISQTTLGFNQPDLPWDGSRPSPMIAQAPLFPVMIAGVAAVGVSCEEAALLLPVLSLAAVLMLAWFVTRILYDERAALIGVFLLLVYHPLALTGGFAWSEATAMVFVLLTFLLLVGGSGGRGVPWRAAAAGVAAGVAFSLRYALLPLVPLVVLVFAIDAVAHRRGVLRILLCLGAAAVPLGLVMGRSVWLAGSCVPPGRPSGIGWVENAAAAARALAGTYLGMLGETIEMSLLLAVLCGVAVLLWRRGSLRATVVDVLFAGRRWPLTAWFVLYIAFVVFQRSRVHFDPLGPRLLAPAGVVGVLLFAAFVSRAVRLNVRYLRWLLLVGLCVSVARETAYAVLWDRTTEDARLEKSERLRWIAANTLDTDVIMGDNMVDVAFYLERPAVLSFSPYPYTDHPTLDLLRSGVAAHGAKGGRACLVLRRMPWNEEETRQAYGDLIADLVARRTDADGTIVCVAELADATVFEVRSTGM